MGIMDEKLWAIMVNKAKEEDNGLRPDQQFGNKYLASVESICNLGLKRAITIRDTFPMYTLHDETHICNVMRLMVSLLGKYAEQLTRDEAAMLILAACCHDIGMSYSDEDKLELLADLDRLNKYLDEHHGEYIKAYAKSGDKPEMTDDMMQNYLRSIHHERIMDLLSNLEWPIVLNGKVNRHDLIRVCQSHGKDILSLVELDNTPAIDLRLCAVLLRLADILDFDASRAPQAIYDYSGFDRKEGAGVAKSKEEWNKHMASHGFDFIHIPDRTYPYALDYNATSKSMQIEQVINCYLDWVDQELSDCGKQMRRFTGKWQNFVLPGKIKRNIKSEGYVSGQYRLTLDQNQIMDLLVGRDLYTDPSVFVRELIQNAIDAVRTREQLDKGRPSNWKAQINIRSWMDEEGYHWFRIEDNGIGMTEDTIMNFFLRVGSSYYNSDTFKQEKLRCKADPNYMPISRFGIGILSCFMGDERTNQVEVSTKHFTENKTYYPALRLSMHGMNGFYYMASKDKNHFPGPMKGITDKEKEQYLKQAGTVIAIRTNLYHTGRYRSFKEIVDRYIVYPTVSIHYDGIEGSFDYPTESDFMDTIHKIRPSDDLSKNGVLEFSLSDEQLQEIYNERPEISFSECPKILLKCIPLDCYTDSPYLSGAVLAATATGKHKEIDLQLGNSNISVEVITELTVDENSSILGIEISLKFPNDFTRKMEVVRREYDKYRHDEHILYDGIFDKYEKDGYRRDIVDALYHNYVHDSGWKEYMIDKYNVPIAEVDQAVKEVEHKLQQVIGLNQDDTETLRRFEALRTVWRFTLCSLLQFDWYKNHFHDIRNKTGMKGVTAHNGIFCGNADFFFRTSYTRKNLGTILLLKDKYRPSVDVTRDGIRQLTLETASDLSIIRNCINDKVFYLDCDMAQLEDAGYPYLPMKSYWDLLEEREDLRKKIIIKTNEGHYSVEELNNIIQEYEQLKLGNPPRLTNRTSWSSNKNGDLYYYLCIAYLRKEFSLYGEFRKYSSSIYICAKKSATLKNYEDIFPSNFFLLPLDPNYPFLTNAGIDYRYACNANHRFSIWMLKNCYILKKHVPGIFTEMLRVLAEESNEHLIRSINELISHLKKLPGSLFDIPNDLFLTENDLC